MPSPDSLLVSSFFREQLYGARFPLQRLYGVVYTPTIVTVPTPDKPFAEAHARFRRMLDRIFSAHFENSKKSLLKFFFKNIDSVRREDYKSS